MFSRDINHSQYRTPRTMNEAWGAYAKLHVPARRRRFAGVFWMAACGIGCGAVWYVALVIGVSR